MAVNDTHDASSPLIAKWPLTPSVTLGSAVRLKGIERELRRRLPWATRKSVVATAGHVVLCMALAEQAGFHTATAVISKVLSGIESLPVLPSEAEDILAISSRERQKWLKDGRLKSAGTRTVKLRGRAKAVTFHVFDPRHIEDVLDHDHPSAWREVDALAIAESRRRAAGKAALARAAKTLTEKSKEHRSKESDVTLMQLEGWDVFAADGLLR